MRDKPYNTYKKRDGLDNNLNKARSSIVVVITILLETIASLDQVDRYIALISSF
jgi:hypothetical protein